MWPRILGHAAVTALALAGAALAQDGATATARLAYRSYGQPSNFGTRIDPQLALAVDLESALAPALALSGASEGDPLFWLFALEPTDFDLGLGGRLLVDPASLVAVPDVFRTSGTSRPLRATDPSLQGATLFAQAIAFVPVISGGGALLSNGLAFRSDPLAADLFPRVGSNAELVHAVEGLGTDTVDSLVAAVAIEAPGSSLELTRVAILPDHVRVDLAVVVPTVPSGNVSRAVRRVELGDASTRRIDVYLADLTGGQSMPLKLIAVLHTGG